MQSVENQNCIQTRCQEFKAANSCLDAAIFYYTLMHQENTVLSPFFPPPALPCNNNIYSSIRHTMMKCSVIILPETIIQQKPFTHMMSFQYVSRIRHVLTHLL